jgi:hypothetical protein
MIYESGFWKDDLLRSAEDLRRRCKQKRWTEVSIARLEHRVMVGFYAVRKLREARKIADRLRNRQVPLTEFPPSGRPIRRANRIEIDEIYDLNSQKLVKKPLDFVANQIIHSFIFTPGFNETGLLEQLFFASDDQKDFRVFSVAIEEIANLFEEVGNNYPSKMTTVFDASKNREIIRVE